MSTDWVARGLAGAGLLMSGIGLAWSIFAWSRSGPHLRVQALAYGRQLEIRVFNSGRSPNTVVNMLLGGRPDSDRVADLTGHLELPWRLEPGDSKMVRLDDTHEALTGHWQFVRGGWSNLWLLAGSMHRHQYVIVPTSASRASDAGWRFAPRGTTARRWMPLVIGGPMLFLSAHAGDDEFLGAAVVAVACLIAYRGVLALRRASFARRRVERWSLGVGALISIGVLTAEADRPAWEPIGTVEMYLLFAYVAWTATLASSGGPPAVRQCWRDAVDLAAGALSAFASLRAEASRWARGDR